MPKTLKCNSFLTPFFFGRNFYDDKAEQQVLTLFDIHQRLGHEHSEDDTVTTDIFL